MAKYVCDFDRINNTISLLNEKKELLNSNVSKLKSELNEDLSSWTGDAKNIYKQAEESKIQSITNSINCIEAYTEHLKKVVETIQATDESLASLSI